MGVALAGRRRWIWLAAAVAAIVLLAFGVVRMLAADAMGAVEVPATVAVDRGVVSAEVATTGTLQPAQTRSLAFAVAGTVEAVKVRAGATVKAGQVLATVDDVDATEAVDSAEAVLAEAQDALAEAKERASATAVPTCARANVVVLRSSLASAVPSAVPSPPVSATAAPSPGRTSSPPQRASPAPDGAASTCTGSGQQGGGQNGDAILSAQQRVNQAKVTLARAQDALAGAVITAPIAGRVLSVSGKVGSRVSAGSAFVTLADVHGMQIGAAFPEADADRLEVRQKAVVTLADRPGESFAATIVQVDPVGTSDGTLTRFGVVLTFDEAPAELLVGQSAAVRVTTGSRQDVLRVPSAAVHDVAGDSGAVFRDGTETAVTLGLRGDQYTEIVSGLTEGDVVRRSW